jgi:hypothetical protein
VFEVGAEDLMAVLDAIDDGGQLAAHVAVQARAEIASYQALFVRNVPDGSLSSNGSAFS